MLGKTLLAQAPPVFKSQCKSPIHLGSGADLGGAGRARTDDDGIMSSEAMTASKSTYACLRWHL